MLLMYVRVKVNLSKLGGNIRVRLLVENKIIKDIRNGNGCIFGLSVQEKHEILFFEVTPS